MKIDIQSKGVKLTDSVLSYLDEQIFYRLSNRFDQIKKLSINLSKGANAKRCKIRISFPRLKDIVVEEKQANINVAIFRGMEKATTRLCQRLNRFERNKKRFYVPSHGFKGVRDESSVLV